MTPITEELIKKTFIKHNTQLKIWNLTVKSIAYKMSCDIIEGYHRVQKSADKK